MHNVKAAVSRLDFAPKAKEMEVTDIATGHFVFTPRPDEPVSYRRLSKAIQGAGYKIEKASIEVKGLVSTSEGKLALTIERLGQVFWLMTKDAVRPEAGAIQTVKGFWSEEDGRQTIQLVDPNGSAAGSEKSP